MPRTFLATLQFDGTRFLGWQRQREGRTVQQEVETVLARLAGQPVRVHAAGRTDAGVHALGLGVSFTLSDRWTPDALQRALNALFPADCFVLAIREARSGFHARTSATERQYRYRLGTDGEARSPFRRPFEWARAGALEAAVLDRAAEALVGDHDFGAFAVKIATKPHTRCELRRARWTPRPDGTGFELEVAANRFLHHMVRILVATMVDVAAGRRPVEDMERLLARDPLVRASAPAPPQGLYFMKVVYPESWFTCPEAA
jgi:tRNA pseudouridine38-40 synthase